MSEWIEGTVVGKRCWNERLVSLQVAAPALSFVAGQFARVALPAPPDAKVSKMGILTPTFMRKYRRHAIVVILIISAVVTPTPDMVTQTLLALPMFFLYEVSIFVSKFAQKKKNPPVEHAL
jgi:hypothetical protein